MKIIDKINLELEIIKQGLCFNAWDCGEEEPKDKMKWLKNKINNLHSKLNKLNWELEKCKD